jgi:hypothetical protein
MRLLLVHARCYKEWHERTSVSGGGGVQMCWSHAFSVTGLAKYAPMLHGMQSQPKAGAWVPAIRRQTHEQFHKEASG